MHMKCMWRHDKWLLHRPHSRTLTATCSCCRWTAPARHAHLKKAIGEWVVHCIVPPLMPYMPTIDSSPLHRLHPRTAIRQLPAAADGQRLGAMAINLLQWLWLSVYMHLR